MEKILNDLEQHSSWKELMRTSCRRNALNTSLAADLTIIKLRQLDQRFKKSSLENMATSWIQNELKAFNWLLIALSSLSDTLIKDFFEEQWNIMKKVFPYKDMTFLKFQGRKLVDGCKSKNRWWSKEQEQMLIHESSKYDKNAINWNLVAQRMFQNSKGAIFRSGKHCREHWLNHLDPNKQRGAWTLKDDVILLEKVANGGKKWSQYANSLKRTEHMVKNRYNSLLIKQKKLTPSIKKEQKLVKQLRARLQAQKASQLKQKQDEKEIKISPSYQSLSEEEECIHQMSPSISQKAQQKDKFILEKQQMKPLPVSDMSLKQQSKKEQICDAVEKSEKIEVQNPLSNYSPALIPNCDLNFLMKEDNQQMKKTIFSQFPRYSPYSPYSPYIISPNTPSNYLPSAPVYVSSQFYNYYHQFMSLTDLSQQSQQESRQNPTKTSQE